MFKKYKAWENKKVLLHMAWWGHYPLCFARRRTALEVARIRLSRIEELEDALRKSIALSKQVNDQNKKLEKDLAFWEEQEFQLGLQLGIYSKEMDADARRHSSQ